jgi:hypothetical protein
VPDATQLVFTDVAAARLLIGSLTGYDVTG